LDTVFYDLWYNEVGEAFVRQSMDGGAVTLLLDGAYGSLHFAHVGVGCDYVEVDGKDVLL
jgi:hypothetical protein